MSALLQAAPRPIFCVVDHAYRSREVAEATSAGRFTHAGITLELGVEPDWLGARLPDDQEWRIEWSKFYYGLDLAATFAATGDARYLQTWERLVRSWIRQVPVGFDRSDVAGRRIQNWIYAWIRFGSAPAFRGLAGEFVSELVASLADQVEHLRTHLTAERNHRTLELYALFIAALALPEVDPMEDLLDFAVAELHRNLLEDVRPDGVHREASTHYHMIALRTYLGARENARRFGLVLAEGYDDRLARACDFALHCHRPDGGIPALSDSDTGSYRDLLALAGTLLARPDLIYAATSGARGAPPVRKYVSFPQGGYYIQRSGWGNGATAYEDERYLIFDCGPLGDGGHGHYDLLSVEVAAGGRPLIIDPGRFTYSDAPPDWRRRFKATTAHNTVTVDGLDQTPYQRGRPKGPAAEGHLIRRLSAPRLDLLHGEVRSPAYEVVHVRHVAFVADEYWVIGDQLRGQRPHTFELRLHLTPEAEGRTTVVTRTDDAVVHAPGLALVLAPGRNSRIEGGWFAPLYGVKQPAPVVKTVATGEGCASFLTLVIPGEKGVPAPSLRLQTKGSGHPVTTLKIAGVGRDGRCQDFVAWSPAEAWLEVGPFRCRAELAWSRQSSSGEPVAFSACRATDVQQRHHGRWTPLPVATKGGWVSWDREGGITVGQEAPSC